ncbi:unnamed protein product [Lactuca virosa]|uniref:Uncharacterized protein n=1 Tax=Lactuca virosa TaxID=75947 RepID=A0AAU9PPN2_9ASTR|nr:unnamed protein product [Lactuca virosa]
MVRVHYKGKLSLVVRYSKFLNGGLVEGNSRGQPIGFLVYRIMDRMGRHYRSGYGFGALSKARVQKVVRVPIDVHEWLKYQPTILGSHWRDQDRGISVLDILRNINGSCACIQKQ